LLSVHNNVLMMIDFMAEDAQVEKWIRTYHQTRRPNPSAGEPHGTAPTSAKRVPGGYVVSGIKHCDHARVGRMALAWPRRLSYPLRLCS
jgi:hypothetical protein